jgi:hypothetical protein
MDVTAGGIFTGGGSAAEAGNDNWLLSGFGLARSRRSDLDSDTFLRFDPDTGREICRSDDQERRIMAHEVSL